MNGKLKYFISILLSFIMIIGFTTAVSAVEPRYSDTNSVTLKFVFSDTTAYCDVTVVGRNGTTSISDGHLTLTDSTGNPVGDWTDLSSSNNTLMISKTVTNLNKGETYTLSFSAKVNRNGNTEYVSNSSTKTCPNK